MLIASAAVITAAASSPAGAVVDDEEQPTPPLAVAGAASVAVTAERIFPDRSDDLILFPVSTAPRCVVADNYGGDSKANGAGGHEGVDIGADEGTPVYAVEDGVLTRQLTDLGSAAGLGWILLGVSDTQYRYYHLFDFADGLEVGSEVERGQLIGSVGSTGNAHPTGWHLHFEVRPGPQPDRGSADSIDPFPLLDIPDTCTVY